MMWRCPKLQRYWTEVCSLIHAVYEIQLEFTPLVCILGYVNDVPLEENEKLAVARILYLARKLIAQHWLDEALPALAELRKKSLKS
ncbi:hypothetical protein GDO78_019581 [Eleutherodactylus coqui]|uniref:Uncharacterized protein n=1 Tax=Eleutherodactylus coqui TaxID=57060 RepID=A0A8J6BCG5_ELECQ|nr:hypothetical protein GDO78_019581 [Eleutherodactylus coqui]